MSATFGCRQQALGHDACGCLAGEWEEGGKLGWARDGLAFVKAAGRLWALGGMQVQAHWVLYRTPADESSAHS